MLRTRLGIRGKILLGFVALIIFFIINVIFIFRTINNSREIVTGLFEDKDQSVILLNDFKDLVLRSKMYTLNWVFQRKDEEGKAILKEIHAEEYPVMKANFEKSADIWGSKEQYNEISKILLNFEFLKDSQEDIMKKLASFSDYDDFVTKSEAEDILETSVIPQSNKILAQIDQLLQLKKQEKQIARQNILNSFDNLSTGLIFSLGIVVLIGLGMSFFAANKITQPIQHLKILIDALGRGEQPKLVEKISNDEIGDMSKSVNQLITGLNATSQFAEDIGRGNFDSPFTPLSARDVLGNSLMEMRDNLKKVAEEDKKRYWANEGNALFSDMLRRYNTSVNELANHLMASLVKFVRANQGSFFIVNDDIKDDIHLQLISCYAWNKQKFIKKRVDLGEGSVGQAWIEKDVIFLTDIPNNYIQITSGLGESNPRCIMIIPLIFNDEVFGVIELASFNIFEKHEIDFLKKLAENIASSVSIIKNNERTKHLLTESQLMSEQLRTQEEEMRQNLEELMAVQDELQRKVKDYEQELSEYKIRYAKGNGVMAG
jgi:HAMP domain-containing protein